MGEGDERLSKIKAVGRLIADKKKGKHTNFIPGVDPAHAPGEHGGKSPCARPAWGLLQKHVGRKDSAYDEMRRLHLPPGEAEGSKPEGAQMPESPTLPKFLDVVELAINKKAETARQLERMAKARSDGLRHLNRYMRKFNDAQEVS